MSDVKRYSFSMDNFSDCCCDMEETSNGGYVEYEDYEKLEKEIKILRLKNQHSLANNLCPDHRDKQAGKKCLACEIEVLRNLTISFLKD